MNQERSEASYNSMVGDFLHVPSMKILVFVLKKQICKEMNIFPNL